MHDPAGMKSWWSVGERWPSVAAVVSVPVLLVTGLLDDVADGVVVAAVLYLAWGLAWSLARHRAGEGRWVVWQVPGVLLFGAINAWAVTSGEPYVNYALAVGWLAHAAWDVVHFRANRVVPRWWSEWCVVLDVLLAVMLIVRA